MNYDYHQILLLLFLQAELLSTIEARYGRDEEACEAVIENVKERIGELDLGRGLNEEAVLAKTTSHGVFHVGLPVCHDAHDMR